MQLSLSSPLMRSVGLIFFLPLSSLLGQESKTEQADILPPQGVTKAAVIAPLQQQSTWLGFEVLRADEAVRAQLPKLPKGVGFIVCKVDEVGPAHNAGMQAMDVLWKFDDQLLINEVQLDALMQLRKVGEKVQLTIFRAGEQKILEAQLGAVPQDRPMVGPTIASIQHPSQIPQLTPPRAVDVNTRTARYEDGNAVVEMELREEGAWLSIINQEGSSVFEGILTEDSEKKIPAIWHDQVAALKRTLVDRMQHDSKVNSPTPDAPPKLPVSLTPVSPPR
jgi:PDZ domain